VGNGDCGGTTKLCNQATNMCVQCVTGNDCGDAGWSCASGVCDPCSKLNSGNCCVILGTTYGPQCSQAVSLNEMSVCQSFLSQLQTVHFCL
jgi:hypothetical protein